MFITFAVHRHKPEYEGDLVDSMRRFGEAMQNQPGFQRAFSLKDSESGALVGLAIWDSEEDFDTAHPVLAKAIANHPFEKWEDQPPVVFRCHPNFEIVASRDNS